MDILLVAFDLMRLPDELILTEVFSCTQALPAFPFCFKFLSARTGLAHYNHVVFTCITVVVLVRELGVTLLRLLVIRHGVIPASRGGKLKTVLQSVAIALYLVPRPDGVLGGFLPAVLDPLALVVMLVAVVVTVVTGVDYVLSAVRQHRARRPGGAGRAR